MPPSWINQIDIDNKINSTTVENINAFPKNLFFVSDTT